MLYYFPQEASKTRYTWMMSRPGGWVEQRFVKHKIAFTRINGTLLPGMDKNMSGPVLDCYQRSHYSLTQVAKFIKMMQARKITDTIPVLYFDDFWTPGIEAIPYCADQMGIPLALYSTLHADSVDKHDFTYRMRHWKRSIDKGISRFHTGLFVSAPLLQELCEVAGIHATCLGLRFDSQALLKRYVPPYGYNKNPLSFIFTSRFDQEKQPLLFLDFAQRMKSLVPGATFTMTSSHHTLRSNSPMIKMKILEAENSGLIRLRVNLTKQKYYNALAESQYQVNCSLQDWVSNTLLEALTVRCIPIYPNCRSFPDVLDLEYLYKPGDVDSMVQVAQNAQFSDFKLNPIVKYHDGTLDRMLIEMGFLANLQDPKTKFKLRGKRHV